MKKNKINNFENKFRTKKNQKQVLLYKPYKFFTWKKKKRNERNFLKFPKYRRNTLNIFINIK